MEYIINKFITGIDFDNVLCNTSQAYLDLFNSFTGEHFIESDLTEYDTTKIFPKKYENLAKSIWNWPLLYKNAQPYTDSQQYMKRLSMNPNIETYVVSVSHPDIMKTKTDFIKREYPFIQQNHIVFINNKQLLKLNVLVDDKIGNLKGGDYHKILLNYFWNQNYDALYNGIIRVNDWSEIYDEVDKYYKAYKDVQELYE